MQNKDKGDGIEDSPLDMLLFILLEGASKEVVMPSSQQVLSEFKLLQTLILCVHKCKRFQIYFKVEFTLGAHTTISVLLLEPEPWETDC